MNAAVIPALSFQELLVASDLSRASEKAVGYAKAIARRYGSHIVLAHVSTSAGRIPIPEGGWVEDPSWRETISELKTEGARLRAEGFQADEVNVFGSVTHEIQSLAGARNSDLLILGTHGRHGLARLIIGSEAESLIRHSKRPVLTVGPAAAPAPSEVWRPRDIICGISLSRDSAQLAALGYMLALNTGATFSLIHVEGPYNPADEMAWERFDQEFDLALPEGIFKSWPVHSFLSSESPGTSMAEIANRRQSDLIILGIGNSTFISSHLGQGVLPSVFLDAPCPVLTIKAVAD